MWILLSVLLDKFKEVLFSVLPITGVVVLLHFTLTPLDTPMLLRFLIGSLLVVIGLSIFLFGTDIGITPIGQEMGKTIAKRNSMVFLVLAGLVLGFFISIAEPDLHILAEQIRDATAGGVSKIAILVVVSLGIAIMLSLGLVRIVKNVPLYIVLAIVYTCIFILSFFVSEEFLAISFDASGATTGALTVPFILALSLGVSQLKKDSKASEKDSFGLVAIASSGAIIAVMLMCIFTDSDQISGATQELAEGTASIWIPFLEELKDVALEIVIALAPIAIIFWVANFVTIKLKKRAFLKINKGLIYTFIGLVLFLVGVNAGFMEVGSVVGYQLAALEQKWIIILVSFFLGVVTILAEPAVHVLTHQIEDVTSGSIKRSIVMATLALGVGAAVTLSIVRILFPALKLWHFLLPGYVISIALMFVVPKLFVGIAFDSGGVASGPMTATFILAFAQGAAHAIPHADVLVDGFGLIAMVAMTPLIALQLLGLVYKMKARRKGGE